MYKKTISSNHSGLFIFIIDQSKFMNNQYNESKCIETASVFKNSFISDLMQRCWCGGKIARWAYIVIIGHGGEMNDNACLLFSGWVDDIAYQEREIVNAKCSRFGSLSNNHLQFATLHVNGEYNSYLHAFESAYYQLEC